MKSNKTTSEASTTGSTASTTPTCLNNSNNNQQSSIIELDMIIDDYLYQHLGPQQALPLIWLIVMTVVYILILITGLCGNIITILVIFRFRYMQTLTNLYLCNLAITDLISLMFSLPLELYTLWHQYPWQLGSVMCSMKTLILEGTANASVLTLVAFTIERFLAICGHSSSKHQTSILFSKSSTTVKHQTLFNCKSINNKLKRLAYRNIVIIWLISIVGAMPLVLLTNVNYLQYEHQQLPKSAWCGLAYNVPDKRWELIIVSSTIVFFFIPLSLITLLYYKIARKLKKVSHLNQLDYQQSKRMDSQLHSRQQLPPQQQSALNTNTTHPDNIIQLNEHVISRKILQSRRLVIRMLVVIVIVFTFCWSPFHAQRLLFLYVTLYSSWNWLLRQINGILFLSAGCLYYLNSSLNPLIYSLLSTRFRAAFMLYVQSCYRRRSNHTNDSSQLGRHRHNSSGAVGTSQQQSQQGPNSNSKQIRMNHRNQSNNHHDSSNFDNRIPSILMAANNSNISIIIHNGNDNQLAHNPCSKYEQIELKLSCCQYYHRNRHNSCKYKFNPNPHRHYDLNHHKSNNNLPYPSHNNMTNQNFISLNSW